MPTIQIEQISREEALARCQICTDRNPHLHFYIVARDKQFKTFGDCLVHSRDRMVAFADHADDQDFHSMNGGMSREEYLSPDNVRQYAKKVWEEDKYILSAETVSCHTLMDDNVTEIVANENFKGFVKT